MLNQHILVKIKLPDWSGIAQMKPEQHEIPGMSLYQIRFERIMVTHGKLSDQSMHQKDRYSNQDKQILDLPPLWQKQHPS